MHVSFFKGHFDRVTNPVHHAGAAAFHLLELVVVIPPVISQHRHGDQPVGTGLDQGDVQSGTMGAVNAGSEFGTDLVGQKYSCLLYTSPSPRDRTRSRMPSSA